MTSRFGPRLQGKRHARDEHESETKFFKRTCFHDLINGLLIVSVVEGFPVAVVALRMQNKGSVTTLNNDKHRDLGKYVGLGVEQQLHHLHMASGHGTQ